MFAWWRQLLRGFAGGGGFAVRGERCDRRSCLVAVCDKSCLHRFPVSDVVKAPCEGFPAFCRIVSRHGFVRQLFGLGVVGIDALALGFVGPFGFGEKLSGLGVVPCLIQS